MLEFIAKYFFYLMNTWQVSVTQGCITILYYYRYQYYRFYITTTTTVVLDIVKKRFKIVVNNFNVITDEI